MVVLGWDSETSCSGARLPREIARGSIAYRTHGHCRPSEAAQALTGPLAKQSVGLTTCLGLLYFMPWACLLFSLSLCSNLSPFYSTHLREKTNPVKRLSRRKQVLV